MPGEAKPRYARPAEGYARGMGFPDLQDGRPPPGGAGAELTSGPVPTEMPDEHTAGHPPPGSSTAGPPPAGRTGAHRRSVTSPQRQPWPAAPTVTGPQDRSQSPSRTVASPRDGSPAPRRPPGDGRPMAGGDRRGPLRGFPPAPGQPDPVYPPGQFSPWNRASTRSAWLGIAGAGGGSTDTDPGYSDLAVSDAAADLTATQAWGVADDPPQNPSPPARGGRDWGSHTRERPRGLAGPTTGPQK